MTRLTNALRIETAQKILDKTFEKRYAAHKNLHAKLAIKARDAWLGPDKRAYLKLAPKLQHKRNSIQLNLQRMGKSYDRHSFFFEPKFRIEVRSCSPSHNMVYVHTSGLSQQPVGGDNYAMLDKNSMPSELWTELVAFVEKEEALAADVRKLCAKIMEQLRGCTTVKKLNELWPEAVTYVPASDNPLAVIIDRDGVNNLIACMKKGDCA